MVEAIWLVVILSSLAVLFDANRLGAKRGGLGGGLLDMGAVGWFFTCLIVWIPGMVCYAIMRPKLVDRRIWMSAVGLGGPYAPPGPVVHAGPSPGWYPDPAGFGYRWWDGVAWTPYRA
jgi:hypothetical protein